MVCKNVYGRSGSRRDVFIEGELVNQGIFGIGGGGLGKVDADWGALKRREAAKK